VAGQSLSSLTCHSMVSKRQSTAMWCGGTEIPVASNLLIDATPRSITFDLDQGGGSAGRAPHETPGGVAATNSQNYHPQRYRQGSQDGQGISLSRASGVTKPNRETLNASGDIRGTSGEEKNFVWDPLFGSTPRRRLFVDKVRDIVGLYLSPPNRALVLSVDEKAKSRHLIASNRSCR